jgi:hypothetical protein
VTDVMDAYKHLESLTQVQLFERRNALIGSAPSGDYRQLSDESLQELIVIVRILRRHSGSSTKTPRTVRTVTSEIPTPDML